MNMGQHQGRVTHVFAFEPVAHIADAGAAIEDDPRTSARYFDTACIAADGNMIWRGTGDASPNPPKLNLETHKKAFVMAFL